MDTEYIFPIFDQTIPRLSIMHGMAHLQRDVEVRERDESPISVSRP